MDIEFNELFDDGSGAEDATLEFPDYYDGDVPECPECGGTGQNQWDDGCTPCDYCDGEGYLW